MPPPVRGSGAAGSMPVTTRVDETQARVLAPPSLATGKDRVQRRRTASLGDKPAADAGLAPEPKLVVTEPDEADDWVRVDFAVEAHLGETTVARREPERSLMKLAHRMEQEHDFVGAWRAVSLAVRRSSAASAMSIVPRAVGTEITFPKPQAHRLAVAWSDRLVESLTRKYDRFAEAGPATAEFTLLPSETTSGGLRAFASDDAGDHHAHPPGGYPGVTPAVMALLRDTRLRTLPAVAPERLALPSAPSLDIAALQALQPPVD